MREAKIRHFHIVCGQHCQEHEAYSDRFWSREDEKRWARMHQQRGILYSWSRVDTLNEHSEVFNDSESFLQNTHSLLKDDL